MSQDLYIAKGEFDTLCLCAEEGMIFSFDKSCLEGGGVEETLRCSGGPPKNEMKKNTKKVIADPR